MAEKTDIVKAYLEKNGVPVTRENYIGLAFAGDYDPKEPLPGELEASLPAEIQLKENTDNANEE